MTSNEVKIEKINLRKYAAPSVQRLRREKCVYCEKMMNIGEMKEISGNPKVRLKLYQIFGRKFENNCERSKMPLICHVHLDWVDLEEIQRIVKLEEEEEAEKKLEKAKAIEKRNERKRNAIKIGFPESQTTSIQNEDPEERERIAFFMEKRKKRLEQQNETVKKEATEIQTDFLSMPPFLRNSRQCKLCGEWELFPRTIELPRDLTEVSQVLGPIHVDFHPGYICESHVDVSLLEIMNRQKAKETLEEQKRIEYYMDKRKKMLEQKLMTERNLSYCKYCQRPEELKNMLKLPVKTGELWKWSQILKAPQLFTDFTKRNEYICNSHFNEEFEKFLQWEESNGQRNVMNEPAPTTYFFCKVCKKRKEDTENFMKLPEEVSELWIWSQILKAPQLITSRIEKNHSFICNSHIHEDFVRFLQLREIEKTNDSGECSNSKPQNVTLYVTDYVKNNEELPMNIIDAVEDSAKNYVEIEDYQLYEGPSSSSKAPVSGCQQEFDNEDFKEEEMTEKCMGNHANVVETELWQ